MQRLAVALAAALLELGDLDAAFPRFRQPRVKFGEFFQPLAPAVDGVAAKFKFVAGYKFSPGLTTVRSPPYRQWSATVAMSCCGM